MVKMKTIQGRLVLTCGVIISLFFLGCVMNKLDPAGKKIELRLDTRGTPLHIDVIKGENWSRRLEAGPFIFNVLPQVVIWVEDEHGKLIDTLYITGAGSEKIGNAARQKKGPEVFYTEYLPVWASRLSAAGGRLPSKKEPYPDSITSATPSNDFSVVTKMPLSSTAYAILLEVNTSGDDNDTYNKQNNDWIGQPSLIYKAVISDRVAGATSQMELVGHGGLLHEEPAIHTDIMGIDSARKLIQSINIRY